jgi:hypothetical protein
VEQKIFDKDGKVVNVSKVTSKDANGNIIETETRVDENGNKVVI